MFQDHNCSLSTLSSTSCWACPHHQHVESSNVCHKCIGFHTCHHDTREGAANHTIFYMLLSTHSESWLQSQGWPLDLLSSTRQSVPSPSVQKRMLARYLLTRSSAGLRPDPLAFSTSSCMISRFPEACLCRKLQEFPIDQDPIVFHC